MSSDESSLIITWLVFTQNTELFSLSLVFVFKEQPTSDYKLYLPSCTSPAILSVVLSLAWDKTGTLNIVLLLVLCTILYTAHSTLHFAPFTYSMIAYTAYLVYMVHWIYLLAHLWITAPDLWHVTIQVISKLLKSSMSKDQSQDQRSSGHCILTSYDSNVQN